MSQDPHPEMELNAEEFLNFVAVLSEAAAAKEAQAGSTDHSECTIEGCNFKRLATLKANTILLEELRKEMKALDQTVSAALVDLAPVQALVETVKLLTAEVEKLRNEAPKAWKPKTRKLPDTPADDSDAYDDTFPDTPADDPDAYDDTYGYACAHVDYFNG